MSILVLTSDTLIGTPATGNLEYNGQFYGTDSNASRAQMQRITQGTAVASTSGTSIDFTGLPAWVKRVTVAFNGVSLSGTSSVQVQLGTGTTTYTTSGYVGGGARFGAASVAAGTFTSGFVFNNSTAAALLGGNMTITNVTGNTWSASGICGETSGEFVCMTGGSIALAAVLTAVRITSVNGTDTFDAGSINLLLEG